MFTCEHCGKPFTASKPTARFCSKSCANSRVKPNAYRIEGDVAYLTLTQGLETVIDVADLSLALTRRWCATKPSKHNKSFYAIGSGGEFRFLHRLLLGLRKGDKRVADHRDGNGLNNRRSNLRICTPKQNSCNSRHRPGKCPYRGVRWSTARQKWHVMIRQFGDTRYVASFDDPIEAAKAYDAKAKELHGEFATLNFPEAEKEINQPPERT